MCILVPASASGGISVTLSRLNVACSSRILLQAREGSSVALVGLGADAVKKILLAITMASKFLDGDGISLRGVYVRACMCVNG